MTDTFYKRIYPYQYINDWIQTGLIRNANPNIIQPASLDLTLDLDKPIFINKNKRYIVSFKEDFSKLLTKYNGIKMLYSSRSTTARNGIIVNHIQNTNKLTIQPIASDIYLKPNDVLGQMYFIDLTSRSKIDKIKTDLDLVLEYPQNKLETDFINPSSFYLGLSKTEINIPNNKTGILIDCIPSLGYYYTHLNAGFFDPGFKGKVVYEIITALGRKLPIKNIFGKMVLVDLVEPTEKPYFGNYQNQSNQLNMLPKIDYSTPYRTFE